MFLLLAGMPVAAAVAQEAEVKQTLEALVKAFNSHDASEVSAVWTEDAIFTDATSGERVTGREAIGKMYEDIFKASPEAKIAVTVTHVAPRADDTVVARGTVKLSEPKGVSAKDGKASIAQTADTEFTAVLKKSGEQWLLHAVAESPLPPENPLEPIAFLAGDWMDQGGKLQIVTSAKWTENQKFLTRTFRVSSKGEVLHEGRQIIGWDPAQQQIRCWTFGSNGGFGEGTIEVDGNQLLVHSTGTTADGRPVTSTQQIVKNDSETITIAWINREIDGQLQPNEAPVVVKRVVTTPPGRNRRGRP
jgi:uncharacterized protein (TIGR02246 family)